MQMSSPPRISTVEVVGLVTAFARAPILNGANSTMTTNGAVSAKNNHSEVRETTFTPAILSAAQAITTASATHHPRLFTWNHGNMRVRYATKSVINRHIEDRGHQRQPCFLESPEIAHGPAHPGVITAFVRQRAREFADHERRG